MKEAITRTPRMYVNVTLSLSIALSFQCYYSTSFIPFDSARPQLPACSAGIPLTARAADAERSDPSLRALASPLVFPAWREAAMDGRQLPTSNRSPAAIPSCSAKQPLPKREEGETERSRPLLAVCVPRRSGEGRGGAGMRFESPPV